MPRKSSVWFREEDQCYYTTIRRKQIRLSTDQAHRRHDRLGGREHHPQAAQERSQRKALFTITAAAIRQSLPIGRTSLISQTGISANDEVSGLRALNQGVYMRRSCLASIAAFSPYSTMVMLDP